MCVRVCPARHAGQCPAMSGVRVKCPALQPDFGGAVVAVLQRNADGSTLEEDDEAELSPLDRGPK